MNTYIYFHLYPIGLFNKCRWDLKEILAEHSIFLNETLCAFEIWRKFQLNLLFFWLELSGVLKAEGNYSLHAIMFTLPTAKDFKKNQLVKFPKSRKFTKMLKIVQNAADIFQSQQYFRFENFQHNLNFLFYWAM